MFKKQQEINMHLSSVLWQKGFVAFVKETDVFCVDALSQEIVKDGHFFHHVSRREHLLRHLYFRSGGVSNARNQGLKKKEEVKLFNARNNATKKRTCDFLASTFFSLALILAALALTGSATRAIGEAERSFKPAGSSRGGNE